MIYLNVTIDLYLSTRTANYFPCQLENDQIWLCEYQGRQNVSLAKQQQPEVQPE